MFDENGPIRHGFYTGDAVIFRSLDGNSPIPDGIYYVKEFKNTNEPSGVYGLKLSKSLPNILNRQFVEATEENSTGQCILQFFDYSITDRFNEN